MIPGTIKLTKWVEKPHLYSAERKVVIRPNVILDLEELAPNPQMNYGPRTRVMRPFGPVLVTETIAEIEKLTAEAIADMRMNVLLNGMAIRAGEASKNVNKKDHSPPS